MGILSGIVGAGMQAAAGIAGAIGGAKAARNVKDNLLQQQQENQDWYDQRYNEDATQRADAQRLLTMTNEAIKQRNRQAAGAAAVGGATEESVAAAKAANNQAMADAVSTINAQADARKDKIEQTYQQNNQSINAQLNQNEKDKAAAIASGVKGVADAAGSLTKTNVDSIGDLANIFK